MTPEKVINYMIQAARMYGMSEAEIKTLAEHMYLVMQQEEPYTACAYSVESKKG